MKREYDSSGIDYSGHYWLYLEELLSGEHSISKVKETIKDSIEVFLSIMEDPDDPFFEKYRSDFISGIPVSISITVQILHYLQSIDISQKKYNESDFSRMYIDFITKIFSLKRSGYFSLSSTVRSLMVEMALTKEFSEVYDPFCGTGAILSDINNEAALRDESRKIKLFAQDIIPALSLITFFNISFSARSETKIDVGNSIIKPLVERQFDLVVSEIPFGSKLSSEEIDFIERDQNLSLCRSSKDFLCVNAILSATSRNGRAIVVVPSGILSQSGKTSKIREKMIAEDVIETIIQLPASLYNPYSNIKTAIMVFNKNKGESDKGKIQFIDASRMLGVSGNNNVQQIVDIFKTKEGIEMVSAVVDSKKVVENKCDLSPSIYTGIFNMLENQFKNKEKLYSLEDVATIVIGRSAKDESNYSYKTKLLKIADLKEDILDVYVDNKYIGNYSSIRKDRVRIIDKECLLIARFGTLLKPTIFKPSKGDLKDEIAQDANVIGIVPNENLLLEYLYYLFYDPVVSVQIDTFKTSSSNLPTIRPENLRKLKIPVPDITDQKRYIEREKFRLIEIEKKT
ncbi:MAG TPA: N-6 DNA methylase, partial [bacterium]|nr:N-6 DNA methylase [bacterium]